MQVPKHRRYLRGSIAVASMALIGIALFLATAHNYKHFYELLVTGLVGLQGALLGGAFSKRAYLLCFGIFLGLGLLGDLFFGIFLTKLWYYNYSNWWEYVPLYMWAYPMAGIAMAQSYLLVRRRFIKALPAPSKHALRWLNPRMLSVASALLLPLIFLWTLTDSIVVLGVNFAYIVLLFLGIFGYIARRRGRNSLIDDLIKNPMPVMASIALITYINLFLHELPNTQAWEWVYTGLPWESTKLLDIPIMVFPGWLALGLLPAALVHAVKPKGLNS